MDQSNPCFARSILRLEHGLAKDSPPAFTAHLQITTHARHELSVVASSLRSLVLTHIPNYPVALQKVQSFKQKHEPGSRVLTLSWCHPSYQSPLKMLLLPF